MIKLIYIFISKISSIAYRTSIKELRKLSELFNLTLLVFVRSILGPTLMHGINTKNLTYNSSKWYIVLWR